MIREKLEAGLPIPTNTKPRVVMAIMTLLVQELMKKLGERYVWMASCTVAVEAGIWGGERRRQRRLKLAKMIIQCATYLGIPDPISNFKKGWEYRGLLYGYGVFGRLQEETGASIEDLVLFCPRTVVRPDGRKVKTTIIDEMLDLGYKAVEE